MPLYEYHCTKCRSTFELLRPMSDSTRRVECSKGHAGATRVVSLVARVRGGEGAETMFSGGGGCACGGGSCGCGR